MSQVRAPTLRLLHLIQPTTERHTMRDLTDHETTGHRRGLRRSLASAVAAAGILAGMPVAARADAPAGDFNFRVNGERADFGAGNHTDGKPVGQATVAFTASPTGNVLSVEATVH